MKNENDIQQMIKEMDHTLERLHPNMKEEEWKVKGCDYVKNVISFCKKEECQEVQCVLIKQSLKRLKEWPENFQKYHEDHLRLELLNHFPQWFGETRLGGTVLKRGTEELFKKIKGDEVVQWLNQTKIQFKNKGPRMKNNP